MKKADEKNAPKKRGRPAKEMGGGSLPPSSHSVAHSPLSGGHPRNAPGETANVSLINQLFEVANVIDSLHITPNYVITGKAMVRCTDVKYGNLELANCFRVADDVFLNYSRRYNPQINDIIITRVGSYGITALVTDTAFCLGQNTAAIVPLIERRYLYYVLNSSYVKEQIEAAVVGSTQKTLSLKAINNLRIPRFDIVIEKRIAHILGTLDDKIALNRRINQSLEAMAQALFQSWFVDFDPVKAKQAVLEAGGSTKDAELAAMQAISGKSLPELKAFQKSQPEQYAELEVTAKLFPSKLVESELGLIPEGWEWKSAAQIADIGIGKTPPRIESQWFSEDSNDLKWVSIRDMGESGAYIINTNERLTEASVNKFNVRRIPKNTVLLSFKMTVGRVAITTEEMLSNEAIAHFNIIEGTSIEAEFVYLYLKTFDYNSLGNTSSIAAAVNSKIIKEMPILVPAYSVISRFEKQIKPVFAEILIKQNENVRLIDSRDSLLPKLLSGEIDVSSSNVVDNL